MNEERAGEAQNQKHRAGWKKLSGLVVLLLVAAIGGVIWLAMPPKEPSYHGKPLSYWLSRAEEAAAAGGIIDTKDPKAIECREAIRHIGTNAIATLLRILRAEDSPMKMKLMDLIERQDLIHVPFSSAEEQKEKAFIGFYFLSDLATNAVPDLIDIYTHPPSISSKVDANIALMQLYPAPGVSTPYWLPPEERANWYVKAGLAKSEWDETSNAIVAFSQAIKLDPTNEDAYLNRGDAKRQILDFTGALTDLDKAVELSPSNEIALYARGLCKFDLKDFKGSEADFTRAINLDTNDFRFYNWRGLARAQMRELNDALTDCSKAIELSPQGAEGYRNRAMVETVQKEYELALADASKSIELDDHDATAYASRGRIKNALRDYQAALADFDKAVELNPKDSFAYASRAAANMSMDDFKNAVADLEMALQLNPTNATAYLVRGYLKVKRGGEDDAALSDVTRAVELAPQEPELYGVLGLLQYKASDWKSALANCRKALKLGARTSQSDFSSCIWLIRAQSGEEEAANTELNAYLKSLEPDKTNEWSAITARFLTGSLTQTNFLSLATTSAKRPSAVKGQVCEALYYAGMKRKLAGDRQGALALFQKCLDTKDDNQFAYLNAAVELRALKQP